MSAARVPKANAAQTWKDLTGGGARALTAGRTKLWLDGRRSFSLDESVKQIGAPQAWQQGMTGKGVTVAVLDSGYDPDHPDLKDAVRRSATSATTTPTSATPSATAPMSPRSWRAGMRSIGAWRRRRSWPSGRWADAAGPTDSAVLAGMEWAAVEVKAKVVNMSFGDTDAPDLDPLEQAVNTLSERTGTLFVAAAGNGGASGRVSSPGSAEAALSRGRGGQERAAWPNSPARGRE